MSDMGLQTEDACTCPYTDEKTWLSAASCGYGSGYEPGSMQEWNPDCPIHRPTGFRHCPMCDLQQVVVDEFDDQIGYEEQARPVHVIALDCGHDIWWELRR